MYSIRENVSAETAVVAWLNLGITLKAENNLRGQAAASFTADCR